jgi:hypothetical protein
MSKSKAASTTRQPTVQEHAVASPPQAQTSEHGFKTHWQGGNPFERLELVTKVEKTRSR